MSTGIPIARFQSPHAFPVEWSRTSKGYLVTYGADAETFTRRQDLEAAQCFGEYTRHAAECAGLLHKVRSHD